MAGSCPEWVLGRWLSHYIRVKSSHSRENLEFGSELSPYEDGPSRYIFNIGPEPKECWGRGPSSRPHLTLTATNLPCVPDHYSKCNDLVRLRKDLVRYSTVCFFENVTT